jgi:hypothetical protein
VREIKKAHGQTDGAVLSMIELAHRGHAIKDALEGRRASRRNRRQRKTRYREARFLNRNPSTCAGCGKTNVPLQIEHIEPKSKGGSDRVSNLTLACQPSNQKKSNLPLKEFLKKIKKSELEAKIKKMSKAPLKDAAAVNSVRWELHERLVGTGLRVESSTGGRTKYNRSRLNVPKSHALDAACVGSFGDLKQWDQKTTSIISMGHGNRVLQRNFTDKKTGKRRLIFMPRHKNFPGGFKTGDMVKASQPRTGLVMIGRIQCASNGNHKMTIQGKLYGFQHKNCTLLQKGLGYDYRFLPKPLDDEMMNAAQSS